MKTNLLILAVLILSGCIARRNEAPVKYAASAMQADFDLFQEILEDTHPGLGWYTPKDSVALYFKRSRAMIKDSMTAQQFRLVLSYVISTLRCGHTAARLPKDMPRSRDSLFFPLQIKLWPDTAIITQNISRIDSQIRRGYLLHAIDGRPMKEIVDSLFQFVSTDGFNLTHKYQTLSNRGVFGNLYTNVYGVKPAYSVLVEDSLGNKKQLTLHSYVQSPDSARRPQWPSNKLTRKERKLQDQKALRNFYIDTALRTGVMELNTFTKSAKLRSFFRETFKKLEKENIDRLVIDLRSNGGGSVTYSNLLTKYLAKAPFKIADSLYALRRHSKYRKYQQSSFLNTLFLMFMTRKESDGFYHFRYFENRYFRPRSKNHYSGDVYILSGGNTYSASTLVISSLKDQENVTIVGEETGGGEYGNNAWLIPDVTLPNTKLRFRLPLFRLVVDKDLPKGLGVAPEVEALPSAEAIRNNRDFKMDAVRELIRKKL